VDAAGLFLRASKLWQLYHDSGAITYARSPLSECTVIGRLMGFRFANRGGLALQTEYMIEFGRMAGIRLRARLVRSTFDGSTHCEWHYTLEPSAQNVAALSALPLFDDSLPLARSLSTPPRSR
jgi:hypothetical protein